MFSYIVRTHGKTDEDFGPGAFDAVLRADDGAQFELAQYDDNVDVETWNLKTSRDMSLVLDQELLVISYIEVD